jgi:membrane protein involved in colicin uptake
LSYVEQRKKEQEKKVLAMVEEAKKRLAEAKRTSEERKRQADADAKKKFDSQFIRTLSEIREGKPKKTEPSTGSESSK